MSQLTSTLINQSSSQIDKTYKSEWESFLSNLQHVEMGLYHGIMSFELYLEMQTWIKQRDEQQRVDKGKTNHMNELKDVHLVIALGILTQDDVDKDGNEYKAGSVFILDSMTRKFVWTNYKLDRLPQRLSAHVYKRESLEKLQFVYDCHDSPDACETNGEALTGGYRLLGFNPISPRFIDGQIGTPLNFASMWTYGAPLYGSNKGKDGLIPEENQTRTSKSREASLLQLQHFQSELEYLDKFDLKKSNGIDSPLLCALLAASKVFKNDPHFEELIRLCNEREFTSGKKTNALGKILSAELGLTKEVQVDSSAKYDAYRKAYNFYLYWIVRYVQNENDRKLGSSLKGRQGGYDGDMIIREDGSKNQKWSEDQISYGKEFNSHFIRNQDPSVLEKLISG